jgi:hypothetical protein
MNRIKELQGFVAGQYTDIHVFDESLVRKLKKASRYTWISSLWNSSPA